uniref:uncharacterized protein LOC122594884 n=1 Tax=Erigeron canadensis TaxID=72917 RepID=UPI001CB90546|nr:uncharacterized protein LOC122594884 [Erigeron canadensis]
MEEQGGETRESKFSRLEYGGSRNPNREGMEEPVIYQGIQLGRETDVPPEGYDFMYHRMQTETGEKLLPITIGGIPITLPKPGYFDVKKPGPFPGIPPEILKYMYPDYDPSDPHLEGLKGRNPPCPPKPVVFLNEARISFHPEASRSQAPPG